MRTIGLIGGMSWESTALYYQIINREVGRRLGRLHSARVNLVSLDFEDLAHRQRSDDWDGMAGILCDAARRLSASGAQCVLIGTNTMHQVAPEVEAATDLPLLHIADITARAIATEGFDQVALMGTRYTMERRFYTERLASHGIACVLPDDAQRQEIHRIIFEELFLGHLRETSRRWLSGCIDSLRDRGAQGVILGCTELPLIIGPQDSGLPVFDTTALHAMAAVDFALAD